MPDLEVVDIRMEPTDPKAGEDVEFCMRVRNTGDKTAETIETEARVDGQLVAVPPTTTLGPGEETALPCTGSRSFDGGSYTVTATVDPDDHIAEYDDRNNRRSEKFAVDVEYGRIEGTVTDTDGTPIGGAKVYVDSRTDTRTNDRGYFSFDRIPAGDHTVEVVNVGYEDPGERTISVEKDRTATVDFRLRPEEHTVRLDSEPISVYLSGEGTYDHGTAVGIEAPREADGYTFEAWKTADGEIVSRDASFTIEYISTDYDISAHYTRPGKPDLTVEDISWSPQSPSEGEAVTFTATVANEGEVRAADVDIELSVGSHIYRQTNVDLRAGESGDISFGPWEAEATATDVDVAVDYSEQIDEEDESNNEQSESLAVADRRPNLEVTYVTPSPSNIEAGDDVAFEATVENTGEVRATDFGVLVEIAGEQYSRTGIDLATGTTKTISVGDWTAESGEFDATARVDFRDSVDETDETDNQRSVPVTVSASQPDLTVVDVDWRPENPVAGEPVELRLEIRNAGDEKAETVETEARVDGTLAAVPPTMTIGPGETKWTAWTGSYGVTSGSHTVVGEVDPDNHRSESDESNNEVTREIVVGSADGAVTGRVTDTNGDPLSGVRVYLGSTRDTRTDTDGRFSMEGVPAGRYQLEVRDTGYENAGAEVTVEAGETTTEQFQLPPTELTVTLASEPVTVEMRGAGTYDYGQEVTIAAPTERDGYTFEAWKTADGTVVSEEAEFTIDYISTDYDLSAHYTRLGKPDLTVTKVAWGAAPAEGEDVTFTATVENQGAVRAADADIELTVGSNIYRKTDFDIGAGSETTVTFGPWVAASSATDVTVHADYTEQLDEGDESNNELTRQISVDDRQPNLVVTKLTSEPQTPESGDDVVLRLEIKNQGPVPATEFGVLVEVGETKRSKTQLDLPPETSKTITFDPWTATKGETDVVGTVDFDDKVSERDESDNTVTTTVSTRTKQVEVTVDSTPVDVDIADGSYESGDDVELSAPTTVHGYEFLHWEAGFGTIIGTKPELTLTNVTQDQSITAVYVEREQPDITVSELKATPESPSPGEATSIAVVLENRGSAAVSDVNAAIWIDGDRIGTTVPTSVKPGGRTRVELPRQQTFDAGEHRITARADEEDSISESNEMNNLVTETLEVEAETGTIDGRVTSVDDEWVEGATVTLDGDWNTTTSVTGRYEFEGVEPGLHTLSVSAPGYKRTTDSVVVEAGETRSEDLTVQSTDVDLGVVGIGIAPEPVRTDETVSVFVRVENKGRTTVDEVPIELTLAGETVEQSVSVPANEREVAEFTDVWTATEGRHEVTVEIDPDDTIPEGDESDNRESQSLAVGAGAIVVDVTAPDGSPISDATVSVDGTVVTTTGESGSATLEDVSAGVHDLEVTANGVSSAPTSVRVEPRETAEADIELETRPQGTVAAVSGVPDHYEPGTWFTATVTAKNTGRTTETYQVRLGTPDGVAIDGTTSRLTTIPAGETVSVDFRVQVRSASADTRHELIAEVTTSDGERLDSRAMEIRPQAVRRTVDVAVVSRDGEALSDVTVSLVGPEKVTETTGSDGRVSFSQIPVGTYLIELSSSKIVSGGVTMTREITEETEKLTLEAEKETQEATLAAGVNWKDGRPVDGATAVLKVGNQIGVRVQEVEDGYVAFPNPVPPNKYRLVIRKDGEVIAEENVLLEGGKQSISVTAQDRGENTERLQSTLTGAIFGDWCWRSEGEPPGYCGDEVQEYPVEFFGGWLVSGFAIVGDIRDLPSTALKGNAVDFMLTLIALAPAYGDASSVLSKVGKFVSKYQDKASEVAQVIAKSRFFKGSRIKALDEASNNAASDLMKRGFTEDEVVRFADEGSALDEIKQLSEAGLDKNAIEDISRADWTDPSRVNKWLSDVREVNRGDAEEIIRSTNNPDRGNLGHIYEAKVASHAKEGTGIVGNTVGKNREVSRVGVEVENAKGSSDIDVLMDDGAVVETKRSLASEGLQKGEGLTIPEKVEVFREYQRANGHVDAPVYLVTTGNVDPKAANKDLYEKLTEMGVRIISERESNVVINDHAGKPVRISLEGGKAEMATSSPDIASRARHSNYLMNRRNSVSRSTMVTL
ncbi:beta-sandwich domain-containing protein [Salinigranum halophilum]|uniref:beta-sandwich domain-containing protein n=1 Tax=Salinigranum halophilum TaxID=2565931 RepID=UPI001375CC0D|nr:DUF2012 domain-containing protein [Salinigranum halophilum]